MKLAKFSRTMSVSEKRGTGKTILVAHETSRFEKEMDTVLNSLGAEFSPSLRIGAKLGLLRQLIRV